MVSIHHAFNALQGTALQGRTGFTHPPVFEGIYVILQPLQKMQSGGQLVYSKRLALTAKRGHPN